MNPALNSSKLEIHAVHIAEYEAKTARAGVQDRLAKS